MFDILTCPDCDGVLPPGSDTCATCSVPDPTEADPWSLGTPEAVAATTAAVAPPPPGAQLTAERATKSGLSTGTKVAIGVGVALVVLVIVGAVGVFFAGRWLADQGADAFVESFAESVGATEGLDQFQVVPTYSLASFAVGECYSLDGDAPVPTACSDGHYYEVYHQFEAEGSSLPDPFALDEVCHGAFASFVGISYWDSAYFSDTVVPSDAEWSSGERTVTCVLNEPFTELTGSAAGTRR